MVGCGAAAAIAGAFGAPLAGAFYAFELVIGGLYPGQSDGRSASLPVAGYFVTHGFAALSLGISVGTVGDVLGRDLAVAACSGSPRACSALRSCAGSPFCEAVLARPGCGRRCARRWAVLRSARWRC